MKLLSDELTNEHTNKENSLEACLIYKLPASVLGTIFQKLAFAERLRVERVSRLFKHAVRTFGWRNVSAIYYDNERGIRRRPAYEGKDRLTNELIVVLLSRIGAFLCELELCPSKEEKNDVDEFVLDFLNLTPNVVSLRLGILLKSWFLLPLIARQLPRLKSIHFDGCFNMRKLFVHGDETNSHDELTNYSNEICLGLRVFFNTCSQLEELVFVSFDISCEFFAFLPLGLRKISLVYIDLTDKDLMCVAESCPLLWHFSLMCLSKEFTVFGLCALLAKLNGLISLHLIEESLTIDEAARKDEEASDEEIDLLGKTIGDLKSLEQLILYTDTIAAKKLRDSIPVRFLTEQLKELQIGYSRLMRPDKWKPEHCPIELAPTVAAFECRTDKISDESLVLAARRAVRIESLCVKDCRTLSGKSLIEVVRCCKSLRRLSISAEHFTDELFEALNAEMRSRHGDTTPRTAEDEKQRLKISCFVSASAMKKRANPWIEFI